MKRPDLSSVNRVLSRIDEIHSRFAVSEETPEIRPREFDRMLEDAHARTSAAAARKPEKTDEVPSVASSRQESVVREGARTDRAPTLRSFDGGEWADKIAEISSRHEVPEALVRAVIRAESGGNPRAVSPKGAQGLMQLMPGTARLMGVDDPYDPEQNIEGGTAYLASMLKRYGGDKKLALAAYNAGPGRVDAYGGIPPFPETENYVKNVLALYEQHSREED